MVCSKGFDRPIHYPQLAESRLGKCCDPPGFRQSCTTVPGLLSGPPSRKQAQTASFLVHQRTGMPSLRVTGYDMAYLDVGQGPPLVCVHGSLCDFRVWSPVLGPLTTRHRVIALSLRHFFPEPWDGSGDTYSLAQHVEDMI